MESEFSEITKHAMSPRQKIKVLRQALKKVRELTMLRDAAFCTMVTRKEDCSTHTTKWAQIGSVASAALRETRER